MQPLAIRCSLATPREYPCDAHEQEDATDTVDERPVRREEWREGIRGECLEAYLDHQYPSELDSAPSTAASGTASNVG
jgi:hypothetical protein